MRVEHTIDIATTIDRAWELTLDVESWPDHTSTMTSVELMDERPIELGSKVRIKQPGQRARIWTVTALEPKSLFAWAAPVMGASMTATHELEATSAGVSQTLSVELTGRFSRLIGAIIRRPISRAIATENQGFKQAAERTSDRSTQPATDA